MTTRAFRPDPERRMLDQFNHSERERLLPAWRRRARRTAWRLLFAGFFLLAIAAYVLVATWVGR